MSRSVCVKQPLSDKKRLQRFVQLRTQTARACGCHPKNRVALIAKPAIMALAKPACALGQLEQAQLDSKGG